MGKFDHIAILSDLDGTFLGVGGRMVERNLEAIERFKAEGGLFTLATGRMHFGLDNAVPNVKTIVNAPAILCNGTYLYDFENERVLAEIVMDGEKAYEAVAFLKKKCPTLSIRISSRRGYLMNEDDVAALSQIVDYGIEEKTVASFDKWTKDGWYKVVCTNTYEVVCEARRALEEAFPGRFEFNCSSPRLLEMQMRGVNKASMLAPFRSYYRERGRELTIYSCGDFENDEKILRAADVAACPSNASESIKEICDLCFCSHEEGMIADLIEYLEKR